jgi:hypothetical protein
MNTDITGAVEKSSLKICTTSVILKPLPKVNNRPIGENSPKLVTLLLSCLSGKELVDSQKKSVC